jgi:hypothetical protein
LFGFQQRLKVYEINNMSGHYQPTIFEAELFEEVFRKCNIYIEAAIIKIYKFEPIAGTSNVTEILVDTNFVN